MTTSGDTPALQIEGVDHFGPFVARLTYAPNTGRPLLEVIDSTDEVLLREGDEFVTFFAAMPLERKPEAGGDDLKRQLDELEERRRFDPAGPARPEKFSEAGWEQTQTLRAWLAGETIEGPSLLEELNYWRAYLGGDVVLEREEPVVEELRPGVARLEEVPADAVKALDVGFDEGGTASFWHRPNGRIVIRALDGSLVELDPKVLLP